MARVEWSRESGEDVEAAIGIMLCRENPAVSRRRPSRGDKGVDVYLIGADGWTVYQVKRFTGSLTASHKRQITKSYEAFRQYGEKHAIVVHEWILIRPENPTEEDDTWLAGLTADAPFPCRWQGLDHCDRLAADNPSVIDYYFRDGKERLKNEMQTMLAAFHAIDRPGDLGEPAGAMDGLQAIHASINALNPHYRYDFAVQTVIEGALPDPAPAPLLVAAVTRASGDRAVTFKVFARYYDAVFDRPVPGHFKVKVEPGSADEVALRDFIDYGIGFSGLSAIDLNLDLPGGLGGSFEEGTISLGAAQLENVPSADLQIVIFGPDRVTELASADIVDTVTTTGVLGQRFATTGRERYGVFIVELRVDLNSGHLKISVTSGDLTDAQPADVVPGLTVMEALRPPNLFALRMRNGPMLADPQPIPAPIGEDWPRIIAVCEALAVIQRHTVQPVRVPDLTRVVVEQAMEWARVSRLLQGEAVESTWSRVRVVLADGHTSLGTESDVFSLVVPRNLFVVVGQITVPLGQENVQLISARVDESSVRDGHVDLIPEGDDRVIMRWVDPST